MFGQRSYLGLGLFAFVGISALVATHFGFLDYLASEETIFYGGLGLAGLSLLWGISPSVPATLREARWQFAAYSALALAITLFVGLVVLNLISASIGAAGVGILAMLPIIGRLGDGGTAGARIRFET